MSEVKDIFETFKGPARKLQPEDVELLAGYLGCEIAALKAVIEVESAGKGYGPDGRPIILNEPHIFYRQLRSNRALQQQAVSDGLAYARWGAKPYPRTQSARYNWLHKAMALDAEAALSSCSWGLGQVMGFNHKACGYPSAADMVLAMMQSEGAQLFAMCRFIVSNSLQRHVRSKSWSSFARGYNGSSYAKHGYHTKLARAYARQSSKDKVVPPAPTLDQIREVAAIPVAAVGARAMKTSRTMNASTLLIGGGGAKAGLNLYEGLSLYEQSDGYISRGDIAGMLVGFLILGVGLYIAYVRWDDAGRPALREIFR